MNLVIFDPKPSENTYLTDKYIDPLVEYCKDTGQPIRRIDSFDGVKNSGVVSHSIYLSKDAIDKLKNNGNRIYSFDINDSSIPFNMELSVDIDIVFKFSGIQQTRYSEEITINSDIEYGTHQRPFFDGDPDDKWNLYSEIRDSGKLVPLPYPPFHHFDIDPVPFDNKQKKAVIRGGNHYIRYHLFLNLLKAGLINTDSGFTAKDYFKPEMQERFRYCPNCIEAYEKYGGISYSNYLSRSEWGCNNPYLKWKIGSKDEDFNIESSGKWNNRCLPLFYWLTEKYQAKHGEVDMALVENALNAEYLHEKEMLGIIAGNMLYGDYKWVFSVDLPPRFWQAANARTVNFLPRWTKNQRQFPEVSEGDHYIAFNENMSGLNEAADITKEQHDHIVNNCFNLYEMWIKPSKYKASVNLLEYILNNIRRIEE